MSLYEKYHSQINRDYMFNMIQKIIHTELSEDISEDPSNFNIFNEKMIDIFKNNNVEEITEINKILLDDTLDYFRRKYSVVEEKNEGSPIDLNSIIKDREILNNELSGKNGDLKEETEEPINNIFMNNMVGGTPVNEIIESPKEEVKPVYSEIVQQNSEEILEQIHINSSKRTNINSSRYNYKIDLTKENIASNDIKKVSRLIIPIEDNYIFSIPVLILNIPELQYSSHMQQIDILDNHYSKVGVYEPLENIDIDIKNVNKITIDIRDITEIKYISNDILKVNILEIIDNIVIFTCPDININNFKEKDNIKIINNYTRELSNIFKHPLKIKRLLDNKIFCRLIEPSPNKVYNNTDMKILNISNQNVLFFN